MVCDLGVTGLLDTLGTCEAFSGAPIDMEAYVGLSQHVHRVQNCPFHYCFQFQKKPSSLSPLGLYLCSSLCLEYTLPPSAPVFIWLTPWGLSFRVHSLWDVLPGPQVPKSEVADICLDSHSTLCLCLSQPFSPCFVTVNVRSYLLLCSPTSLYSPFEYKLCLLPHWAFPGWHL